MKGWRSGLLTVMMGSLLWAADSDSKTAAKVALQALEGKTSHVATHKATGLPRFIRFATSPIEDRGAKPAPAAEQARLFLARHGAIFGLADAARELEAMPPQKDPYGFTHQRFDQHYHGIPVFAARLNFHFRPNGKMTAVNGTLVPIRLLDPNPRLMPDEAAHRAQLAYEHKHRTNDPVAIVVEEPELMVYRRNLERGTADDTFLVWRVTTGHPEFAREELFIGAHGGKLVDSLEAHHRFLDRRVYSGPIGDRFLSWSEGQSLPYRGHWREIVNNLVNATGHTYHLFAALSGGTYLSYDGKGATMTSQFNAPFVPCPNAFWDGRRTTYCAGFAVDDVIAHEWTHAYTTHLHNLIYRWQSGALNEAYSDIFGEAVDQLNTIGLDEPSTPRTDNGVSLFRKAPALLDVSHPRDLRGSYPASAGGFGIPLIQKGFRGDLTTVRDRSFVPSAGCLTIENPDEVRGKVALMRLSTCDPGLQAHNAQKAGAVGVVFYNNTSDLPEPFGTTFDFDINIPVIMVGWSQGVAMRDALERDRVTIDMRVHAGSIDNTYRWLQGEELGGPFGRDMWTPTTMGHPGKVSDKEYFCSRGDAGGVHFNSSIPNHAFALLVDGGTYNGRTVRGIGMQKALHIYWRAMRFYQVPDTDFADHADALEQAARDLLGQPLTPLAIEETHYASLSEVALTEDDLDQLAKALAAVEMRDPAEQCDFLTIMDSDIKAVCALTEMETLFEDDFETETSAWQLENTPGSETFIPTPWRQAEMLPNGRAGKAMYVPNPISTTCGPQSQTGLTSMISPEITVPELDAGDQLVLFLDHYLAVEWNWDGGNIKLQTNDGAWREIAYERGIHNGYNGLIIEERFGNTNPMQGQVAWYGTTDGTNNESVWAQSTLSLTGLVNSGDRLRLRFDLGTDACGGAHGWYIDEVRLLRCRTQGEAGQPATRDWIPHVSSRNSGYKTVLHLSNTGTDSQEVFVQPYTQDGLALAARRIVLTSGATYRTTAKKLFDNDAVSHFGIAYEGAVQVGAEYRPHFSKIERTPIGAFQNARRDFRFQPSPDVFEAMVIVNSGDAPAQVSLTLLDAAGAVLSTEVLDKALAPQAKLLVPINPRLTEGVVQAALTSDRDLVAVVLGKTGADGSLSEQAWLEEAP
ncbi:M4 family metallopeptidase [Acanthopleuribacter pedis]|uniref:M4 family metallopeptidase n=1 Tax=Acanthopleuribacter pedis TaxID=442870 RepID=A0A8J7U875_9BACT|nr:M4 family metallopeptidase [Acanthopleuribacter pedis]MBO1322221.1 M4 family metallopeptidase [Acanthopleuribacter pedis]